MDRPGSICRATSMLAASMSSSRDGGGDEAGGERGGQGGQGGGPSTTPPFPSHPLFSSPLSKLGSSPPCQGGKSAAAMELRRALLQGAGRGYKKGWPAPAWPAPGVRWLPQPAAAQQTCCGPGAAASCTAGLLLHTPFILGLGEAFLELDSGYLS